MFGHRSDGKEVKKASYELKAMACLMKDRADSQVFFNQDIVVDKMDEYIAKMAEKGEKFTYLDILYAAVLRIMAERPKLNRFVINGRLYARHKMTISLTLKTSLSDTADDSTIKPEFNGTETIFEVRDTLRKLIAECKSDDNSDITATDKTAATLGKIPTGVFKVVIGLLMWLDKHGHCPKAIINASPFHTSCYITDVASIGINSIYHHIYNFGTTSMFFAMGKRKKSLIYEDDKIVEERCMNLAFVGDERICDGYYYANSFRKLCKLLNKPELLEEPGVRNVDPDL